MYWYCVDIKILFVLKEIFFFEKYWSFISNRYVEDINRFFYIFFMSCFMVEFWFFIIVYDLLWRCVFCYSFDVRVGRFYNFSENNRMSSLEFFMV